MGERSAKEAYEVERRGWRGMDSHTDLSLLPENYFRETSNLTINGGMHETRPGSTRYGAANFNGIVGEQHGMAFVTTAQGEWCIAHIGAYVYVAIASSQDPPTRVVGLDGNAFAFPDVNHPARQPFIPIQLDFDSNGFRVYKILFRSKSGCKILEYLESSGTWLARAPAITLTTSSGTISGYGTYATTNQVIGTYRVRIRAARIIGGVRFMESPDVGSSSSPNYQEIYLGDSALGITITIAFMTGAPSGATHWIVESTRVLNLVPGTNFSDNGNDPTIFYEVTSVAIGATPAQNINLDLSNLITPKPDNHNFQAIPSHDISVFSGGLLFIGGVGQSQSRIVVAGEDGLSYHSEMYNPGKFIPADEADGKAITALELVGNSLGVWKENKTGVILNRDPDGAVVWRDRKIGAPAQACVAMLTEGQAVVLCHDGRLRIFDGLNYDHALELGDQGVELSNPIRDFTEAIPFSTVSFIWHAEKLHILSGYFNERRALVLHPREGYGWTPWDGLTHFINALAENERKWIFLDQDSGFLYEQSPLAPVYLDRDSGIIEWSVHHSALWPKNRRSSLSVENCFIEGIYSMLTEAHFEIDEQRIIGAAVGISTLAGLRASKYQHWFKCWGEENVEIKGQSIELFLAGMGYCKHRAVQFCVIEEASLSIPTLPATHSDILTYMPSWGGPVVHYARFEQDAELQYDFGSHRRNLSWNPGATKLAIRSHIDAMPPYSGEVAMNNGESDSGWESGWDGMDYLGDDDGACSLPQVFEIVLSRVNGGAAYVEDAAGSAGTWQIKINADGSLQIQLFTYGGTTKRWQWLSVAGLIPVGVPDAPYTIQAALYKDGDALRVWAGLSSSPIVEVTMTRSAQAADSGYAGQRIIARGSSLYISHFRRLARIRIESEAKAFHNLIKGLV